MPCADSLESLAVFAAAAFAGAVFFRPAGGSFTDEHNAFRVAAALLAGACAAKLVATGLGDSNLALVAFALAAPLLARHSRDAAPSGENPALRLALPARVAVALTAAARARQ